MNARPSKHSQRQSGFTAIEVSIFMIAATIVATISTVALLSLSNASADAGKQASFRGIAHAAGPIQLHGPVVATRGSVDVDGNDTIDLAGSDIQAVVKLSLLLTADMADGIDLTPPHTVDSTGVDPDSSTTQIGTVFTVITERFIAPSAAWSVTFPGEDDGDNFLENGERAEVTIWLMQEDTANEWFDLGSGASDPFVDSSGDALVARDQLSVRITTDRAPETSITRTLPIELTSSMLLE